MTRTDRERAAHLGDLDAMRALGISELEPNGFDDWAWDFSKFGRLFMARAALVAATLAADAWKRYQRPLPGQPSTWSSLSPTAALPLG
jgi:hypothetical protein